MGSVLKRAVLALKTCSPTTKFVAFGLCLLFAVLLGCFFNSCYNPFMAEILGREKDKEKKGENEVPPEDWLVKDRWNSWEADESTVTIEHSVDDSGVVTVKVGGNPNSQRWYAAAQYLYTAKENTSYTYEFEAWTESGVRSLTVLYYGEDLENDSEDIWLTHDLEINDTQNNTYWIRGDIIPKSGVQPLQFHCADKIGTFYIKILSITGNVIPDNLPDAQRWSSWAENDSTTIEHSVAEDGVVTITVGGTPDTIKWHTSAQYKYTTTANTGYTYTFEAWTESGPRSLNVQYYNGSHSNEEGIYLSKDVTITSSPQIHTITGEQITKRRICDVEFQCADQIGTFYVKMISITPNP